MALFREDSVSWDLHADPGMWLAGVRALYLQALHPRAVRGVLGNSRFREDPVGRLHNTARFVAVTTYAPEEKARKAAARVRRIHASLTADDPGTGAPFRLDDPELLMWIHCAATVSYLDVVRRSGLRLTGTDADRYIDEQRLSASLVGLDPETVPATTAAMTDYFEEMRPRLRAGTDAQEIYRFLTSPTMPPELARRTAALGSAGVAGYRLASRYGWARVSRLAYSALPSWARTLYGHPSYRESTTTAGLVGLCSAARMVPRSVRARILHLS